MLLEISGEITPERMKIWSQSKNNTQLWMWLVIETRFDAVKSNHLHIWGYWYFSWKSWQFKGLALKNWCFWTVVLEKTLESPLDCKEIQPVHSEGNQPWIFTGKTDVKAPIILPPNVKNWLIGNHPDAGENWRQEGKGTIDDEMVGWHHWLNGMSLSNLWVIAKDREA